MNIHENTALLDAFVDGELTAEELAAVQEHLRDCSDCQAYVNDVLAIRAAFPTVEDTAVPADFTKKVMEAVANTPQSRPKKQPWGKLLTAACLAVIVLVQRVGLGGAVENADTTTYSTADCAVAESAAVERGVNTAAEAEDVEVPAEESSERYDSDTVYTSGTLAAKNADTPTATQNGTAADESTEVEALPTVRLSAADIGDLLSDREPEGTDTDCVRYLLTREEFDALAVQLAEQDITLEDDSGSDRLWLEIFEEPA